MFFSPLHPEDLKAALDQSPDIQALTSLLESENELGGGGEVNANWLSAAARSFFPHMQNS